MRTLAFLGSVALLTGVLLGQTADKPAFEVADVHVSPPTTFPGMSVAPLRAGRYELRFGSMVDLIATAYGVDAEKVLGGPSWLETDRFDVIARAPANATPETAKVMLQTLLADRFKLVIHDDRKPLPVFVLSMGSGRPKMKPADGSGPGGCQPVPPQGPPQPGVITYQTVTCRGVTSAAIAENLRMMAGGYLDHQVVDNTKLEGMWDFDIKWTARGALQAAGADGISIFDAVDKQLGLKLEPQQLPMPVIVVDAANRKPTDNLPGVGSSIPPAEAVEFEAADIKPSPPDQTNFGIRYTAGGRIDVMGSLREIMTMALEIPPNLLADSLVNVPKFAETTRYTIVAKAPSTGIGAPGRGTGGRDTAPPLGAALTMLRNLMTDRFKLATHKENQEATVYALVVPKGETKLKKADPTARASCKPDPGAPPITPGGGPMIAYRCQNTTMAELATNVQNWAGGYIDHPVVDLTGLEGGFDFVLSWTPRGAITPQAQPGAPTGGTAVAADPGGLTVFEAIEKELGLKMDKSRHSIPVFVVDHLEEKPVD